MKKFNLSKGLIVGLLTFALAIATFGAVKASADPVSGTPKVTVKVTVTDKAHDDKVSNFTWDIAENQSATNSILISPATVMQNAKLDGGTALLGAAGYFPHFSGFTSINSTPAENFESADVEAYTYAKVGTTITVLKQNDVESLTPLVFNIGYESNNEEDGTALLPEEEVECFVTFTVKAPTGASGAYENYTFTSELSDKDNEVTFADVIAAVEGPKVEEVAKKLDAAEWILDTRENKSKDLLKDDVFVSFSSNNFKVKKKLTADKDVEIYLAKAKINAVFRTTVDEQVYTKYVAVENGANTKTKIPYTTIGTGLSRTVDDQKIELTGKVVTKVGDTLQSGKYASSTYEVANNVIRDGDFDPVTIEVADEFSEGTGYDPETDSIVFVSPVQVTVYWANVKKAAGAQLKGSALTALELKQNKEKTAYVGSIPLNDKSAGINVAVNKATYLYASTTAPADEKTKAKYAPNFVVDATPYKKIAVTFAYAQADKNGGEAAIASVTTTDNNKKTVIYSGETTEANPNGIGEILEELQYSTDGTTWYDILENTDPKNDLTTGKLYDLVNGGSKTTYFFRIKGTVALAEIPADEGADDDPKTPWVEAEGCAAKNAARATKPVKATVAAAKDAKAVKINVANGTIALKNGYDYAVTANEKTLPTLEDARTILPFNKEGKASWTDKVEGVTKDVYDIDTASYVPVKKVTDNANMFTKIKVKSIVISDITDIYSADQCIWVRKSATAAKPAEKWVCIPVSKITAAPTIANEKSKDYYIAQAVDDAKGIIATPEIKNATSDKNSGAYEFLVVDAKDIKKADDTYYADIDESTAKWTVLKDKGVTVGKTKSKYSAETGKKATDHVLKDGSAILIRRAGDKSSGVLASHYIVTMVAKQDVTYKDADNKDQTKALYVWKAFAQAAE